MVTDAEIFEAVARREMTPADAAGRMLARDRMERRRVLATIAFAALRVLIGCAGISAFVTWLLRRPVKTSRRDLRR